MFYTSTLHLILLLPRLSGKTVYKLNWTFSYQIIKLRANLVYHESLEIDCMIHRQQVPLSDGTDVRDLIKIAWCSMISHVPMHSTVTHSVDSLFLVTDHSFQDLLLLSIHLKNKHWLPDCLWNSILRKCLTTILPDDP